MRQMNGEEKRPDERTSACAEKTARAKRNQKRKDLLLAVSIMLIIGFAVGGTVAWLTTSTLPVENQFTPSSVTCKVEESFSNNIKSDVKVENTGDTEAYIRVRLISYRQNGEGDTIGGEASIEGLELKLAPVTKWVSDGDYYYYTDPVAPYGFTDVLIESYTLGTYADGESQVLEVLAEAIQSSPASAANEAWGVTIYPAAG